MTRRQNLDDRIGFRCEAEFKREFMEACERSGKVAAEVQRRCLERWMREVRAIERAKESK